MISIVLYSPEIPGNTGAIGRTCVALNARLILIKPYGFDISEKAVRRAGLDYWKHLNLTEYDSFDEFITHEDPKRDKLFFLSKFASTLLFEAKLTEGCYLVFGKETLGLPDHIHDEYKEHLFKLPIFSEHVRSLNLANVATTVAYEAIRQIKFSGR